MKTEGLASLLTSGVPVEYGVIRKGVSWGGVDRIREEYAETVREADWVGFSPQEELLRISGLQIDEDEVYDHLGLQPLVMRLSHGVLYHTLQRGDKDFRGVFADFYLALEDPSEALARTVTSHLDVFRAACSGSREEQMIELCRAIEEGNRDRIFTLHKTLSETAKEIKKGEGETSQYLA